MSLDHQQEPDSKLAQAVSPASENGHHGQPHFPARHQGPVGHRTELQGIVEAILFTASEPLSLERLSKLLEEFPKSDILSALKRLQDACDQEGRGLQLAEVAGGYRLVTRGEYATWVRRLKKEKQSTKLSRSALETLAIISYKQPITRHDIEKIRGVETSGVLRTLLDQKLVRIVGRQDVPGRPILYGTSKYFLQRFGLRDLRDLPPLRELQDLGPPDQPAFPGDEESVDQESAHPVAEPSS
ncbi:MAG: SMC-Scp complex subunit ScpB [Nitrospirae bacterium]|nr:MAG: SMC-Scp complex subunit ScpB [Nitrospirota bacterium]